MTMIIIEKCLEGCDPLNHVNHVRLECLLYLCNYFKSTYVKHLCIPPFIPYAFSPLLCTIVVTVWYLEGKALVVIIQPCFFVTLCCRSTFKSRNVGEIKLCSWCYWKAFDDWDVM